MSRTERAIAALLLAVSVAGGALIPRLLSEPAGPVGVALAPGPIRSVVQAPAVQPPPPPAAVRHLQPAVEQRVVPVHSARPAPTPAKNPAPSPTPPTTPPPAAPPPATTPSPSPPPPSPPSTTPSTPTVLVKSPPRSHAGGTRPGNGYGDTNHVHTGPPGHTPGPAKPSSNLRGSGHGRPLPQASPNPVGSHGRGVGHLAPAPPAAAAAAPPTGTEARPQAGGPSSQGGPSAPGVAHGHGH
jgi:hypothetical protein